MHTFCFESVDEVGGTQIQLLRKQLQDIKDEREVLKTTVYKLNTELSKYQAKYRKPSEVSLYTH